MSQTQENVAQKIETASQDNLPAQQEDDFLALASNKVELDLEDAPFLKDETETPEEPEDSAADNAAGQEPETEEAKPFSKKKKILLIGGGVALVVIVALGVFVVPALLENKPTLQNIIVVPNPKVTQAPKVFQVKLDPFILECTDSTGSKKFLQASFILSTSNYDVYHEISNNQKVLRDAIYYYLEIQDTDTLLDTTHQQQLKLGLLDILNKYIINGQLEDLFIDSFLVL